MLLHYIGDDVLMRFVFSLSIFDRQRKPPELNKNSLLVKVVNHLFHGIAWERVGTRTPVTVSIEPAVIERRPLDAEFLKFRNGAEHLLGRDVKFVSPATPAHVVRLIRGFRQ